MSNWKTDYNDANLRLAQKMLELQEALNDANARINGALALHVCYDHDFICRYCNYSWDLNADRCSSPTVKVLLGE
jgi:hypothetical protein